MEDSAVKVISTKEKIMKEVRAYIFIILGVFGFKSTFLEPNHVPSGSMLPTIAIGDFILVNKMAYGLRVPFSDYFSDSIYISQYAKPKRGEIVVFESPEPPHVLMVKRLIGEPGDEIEVIDNEVFINGKLFKTETYKPPGAKELFDDKFRPGALEFHKAKFDDKEVTITHSLAMAQHLNSDKIKVPEDHYFMMGDNRDFSADSRVWGFVPFKSIRGRALFVWFSMVYPWSQEEFHFRPGRIGKSLK